MRFFNCCCCEDDAENENSNRVKEALKAQVFSNFGSQNKAFLEESKSIAEFDKRYSEKDCYWINPKGDFGHMV